MKERNSRFTIGTDFESFLINDEKKLISAIGVIDGTKAKPIMLPNGAGLHYDNVCLELAAPVAVCEKTFRQSINVSLNHTHKFLPPRYGLEFSPSVIFPDEELNTAESREFGCDPDYNAWTLTQNPKPHSSDKNLRTAGAHISIGHINNSGYKFLLDSYGKIDMIRMMDLLIGIPSVLLDSSQSASKRKELYGKAGAHRPRAYGVEYRVLSNFWVTTQQKISLIYNMVQDCLNILEEKSHPQIIEAFDSEKYKYREYKGKNIVTIINTNNTMSAETITTKLIEEKIYSDDTINLLAEELKW